ncbi:AraC family transcriptional regulator [Streptomyces sp. NPDC050803]|uniref:AraC family transcriptional regulator n=1 Tax=unclassified Streptomyces TaxID=2593676 RepID=UPI00344751E7
MDPLEDVLALLDTCVQLSADLVAGGDWAVDFAPPPGVKFVAVRRGSCLLEVDGVPERAELTKGDSFLLTRGCAFTLRSGADVPAVAAGPLFARAEEGVARAGDGDEVRVLGGRFSFGARAQELLLDGLPPVVHLPAGTGGARSVGWALDAIDEELRHRRMGAVRVAEHLAMVMLVHALRSHLASGDNSGPGLLTGLADPAVAAALACVHRDPAHQWTVAELARAGSVSRTVLAERFKQAVGRGPHEYLTAWRIELAAKRLRESEATLAAIAHAVGYGSDSALSTAFKRVMGTSPREYRGRRESGATV